MREASRRQIFRSAQGRQSLSFQRRVGIATRLSALASYGKAHGLQVRPEQAEKFSDLELVNLLGVSLPFHPAEKQALLEAPGLKEREQMLINLLQLGAAPLDMGEQTPPRTLN